MQDSAQQGACTRFRWSTFISFRWITLKLAAERIDRGSKEVKPSNLQVDYTWVLRFVKKYPLVNYSFFL